MLLFGGIISIFILIYEYCCDPPKPKDLFHVRGISKFEYELKCLIYDLHGDLKADAEKVNFKSIKIQVFFIHNILVYVLEDNYFFRF